MLTLNLADIFITPWNLKILVSILIFTFCFIKFISYQLLLRPQFIYNLFYRFFNQESIVGGRNKNKNQRTSGPVNAHLTPGPGIYFNAFMHVYSPGAGADNLLGTNVDANRKPLSLCPFVASFKTISLKYDFKHILNDFIHVYSPRAGTKNPLGKKFWCQQKFLITLPICCQFKKNLFEVWFFTIFYVFFFHVYSPRQGQTTHWGQKFYDNRKAFSLCPYVASFKMISLNSDFMHIF